MAEEKTSAVMQRVSAHFKSLEPRIVEVPEWGESADRPLVIHAMAMNVAAADKIFMAGRTSSFDLFVEALIQLARQENGDPMFTISDRPALRRVAAKEIVERIGTELLKPRVGDELFPDTGTRLKN